MAREAATGRGEQRTNDLMHALAASDVDVRDIGPVTELEVLD